jgi:hypothetical protein
VEQGVASLAPQRVTRVAGRSYDLLKAATALYARADLYAERLLQALRLGTEGVLGAALTSAEKTDLTIALYGVRTVALDTQLSEWEARWYAQALPPAPARLLLAAAGHGRELVPLCEAGYAVDAFEPAAKHAAVLRDRAGHRAETARGSFADLSATVLRGEVNALHAFSRRSYDAVILGWGSFTHVLDARDREELLRACVRLAGHGPVLASFWVGGEGVTRSRALELGAALGRRLAAWRDVTATVPSGQVFRTHCGFAHEFTRAEVEGLAARCGRRVVWGEYGYPHVTFVEDLGRG